MSYDIHMVDPTTKKMAKSKRRLFLKGGTYAKNGTQYLQLNITYNYSNFYYNLISKKMGIRWIYNKTGKECLPVLENAIAQLGTEQSDDYWEATPATPGNAGNALFGLITFCKMCPEGIFDDD